MVNNWGQPELPKKATQVYGKPSKSDHAGLYLDRDGKVQTVHYRMPEAAKPKGRSAANPGSTEAEDAVLPPKARPDVKQKGQDMIGDFRTDALHEALSRAPIEDDMLIALLVLAFAGQNVRVDSGAGGAHYGGARFDRHVSSLLTDGGRLSFDMDTVRVTARATLIDVLSCRRGMSNSGMVSRIAGDAIGADNYLANMGSEEFLASLSRQSLEQVAADAGLEPRARVRETRSALVTHFAGEMNLVHPSARFAPEPTDIVALYKHFGEEADQQEGIDDVKDAGEGSSVAHADDETDTPDTADTPDDPGTFDDHETAYGIAAE